MHFEQLTFFRPEEMKRERTTLAAELYNHTRLLLSRSETDCQFVPIRSMQYQGVITESEVIFVDAEGYAVRDGEGGRMIVLAWQFIKEGARNSLTTPVAIDVVHYHHESVDLCRRLLLEFGKAMNLMLERQLKKGAPRQSMKVIPMG